MKKQSRTQWDEVINTNLGGCFNMCKAVWDGMLDRGFGRIVNIGSINGQAGQYGQVNYAAAKSGIHGFTKALAQEGAPKGITVNAIAPGYIDTDMVSAVPANVLEKIVAKIPVGRLGKAEEIARGVLFLAPTTPGSSRARRCRSTAASICRIVGRAFGARSRVRVWRHSMVARMPQLRHDNPVATRTDAAISNPD